MISLIVFLTILCEQYPSIRARRDIVRVTIAIWQRIFGDLPGYEISRYCMEP